MKKTVRKSSLYPDYITSSVLKIKADELSAAGITHLVFDIDETVVPKRYNQLTPEYILFLQGLEKKGFKILIGSNTKRDLSEITQHLNTVVVRPGGLSFKPFKSYFKKVIKQAGVKPEHIAMVGDRILNDIVGGNRAGLTTILVEPYARRQTSFHHWYISRSFGK